MAAPRNDHTYEQVSAVLRYAPETGGFLRRHPRGAVWRPAKTYNDGGGYPQIYTCGRQYLAHRLAWLLTHGEWPAAEIDHCGLDKSDTRMSALREATRGQNQGNVRVRRDNLSGFKGVARHGAGWRARIRMDGALKHLGVFSTPEAANRAYAAAAALHFGDFARAA